MSFELEEIIELIKFPSQNRKEIRHIINIIKKEFKTYGPEFNKLLQDFVSVSVDLQAMAIKRFQEKHGFTRDEAIALITISQFKGLKQNMNSLNAKRK